jgi:hypothetical protein
MPIADAYREDLAFIHDVDYGSIAREAAARLARELSRIDQKEVLADLRAVGFEAHTTARYRTLPLPPGVVVVEARKAPAAAGGVR